MGVEPKQIEAAFRYLLGRDPGPQDPAAFESYGQMLNILMRSPAFKESPRGQKSDIVWPLAQVFVSHRAGLIYSPIGKNACTFLKRQMVRVSTLPDEDFILPDVHFLTDHVNSGLQLSDYSVDEALRLIADPGYLRFAVLRDPLERLLSAYIEKFVVWRMNEGNIHHTGPVVMNVQGQKGAKAPDFDLGITFREFAGVVISQNPLLLDAHWRPQHLYLEGVAWDRLYRLDQLDEVVDLLEARAGITGLPRKPQNVTRSGLGQRVEAAADLLPRDIEALGGVARDSFYDPALRAAVETFFRKDLELFHGTDVFERRVAV